MCVPTKCVCVFSLSRRYNLELPARETGFHLLRVVCCLSLVSALVHGYTGYFGLAPVHICTNVYVYSFAGGINAPLF